MPTARRLRLPRWALALLAALAALGLAAFAAIAALDPRVEPDAARLERGIAAGAAYLARHCGEDGRFEYLLAPDGIPARGQYNVLRHAGSIYGLGMAYDVVPDPATLDAMRRASRFLLLRHVDFVRGERGLVAVFSLPGEEAGARREAKLGGTALGIVALAELHRLDPASVPVEVLRGLGRFLLHMQEPDGHFVSKYREGTGFDRSFESLYYPGEAMLALARLHAIDGDPRWIEAALRAADWIATSREGTPWWRAIVDHWLLVATRELVPQMHVVDDPAIDEARLLGLARDVGRRILLAQWATGWVPGIRGAFHGQGRTTPSATRLEGLVALHATLPPGDPLRPRLRRAILSGVGFLLAAQVPAGDGGPRAGGLPASFRAGPFQPGPASNAHEIRIDYVQHALSAFVGAHALVER